MNEETLESSVPGEEPVEEDERQSQEKKSTDEEDDAISGVAPAPVVLPEEAKAAGADPTVDWFEPLEEEDDDDDDPEERSVAGESERSESVMGSERTTRKIHRISAPRRKRSHPDDGWLQWPMLGEGWMRKEVVRRSGSSIGQTDVYYMSPHGERVRSRVELVSMLQGLLDLRTFEYKSGKFYDGQSQPTRVRHRVKRKIRERSSSESSCIDRGNGADTPDSYHRLTPSQWPRTPHYNLTSVSSHATSGTLNQGSRGADAPDGDMIKLPTPSSSSRPLPFPSINGEIGSEDSSLSCAKCGVSFTGTWYDKQRKRPCCPSCWAAWKTREHPMIRFRKWIPCGQCVGCHNTINCGECASCKLGPQGPESRKRTCRKRRCICPIRKGSGTGGFLQQMSYNDVTESFDDSPDFQGDISDSQYAGLKSSDTENFSVNVDVDDDDDDDMSTDYDDDDDGGGVHKKRKRRSCGECDACLCRRDCGTCDFCVDKPKFGGSNKKRQKCRLRQCRRQAMRHLLPYQMGQSEYGPEGPLLPGRPKPHYTYSRKLNFQRYKEPSGLDFTDNEDDDSLSKAHNGLHDSHPHMSYHNYSQRDPLYRWDTEKSQKGSDGQRHANEDEDEEELPMITQIFSLADDSAGGVADVENQLMKLLHSLRSSALPILWYAILVEGPQLQLIQCSKQSSMTDTIVQIDPGFCYQVTVQKQPLLPTHPLYDMHPGRLTTVGEVVDLLLGLDSYVVCRGLPPREHLRDKGPLVLERASTCDFLVKRKVSICSNCRALQGL